VKNSSWNAFRWLISRYARRHLGVLLLLAGLTVVANLLTVVQPAILAALLANLQDGSVNLAEASWVLGRVGPGLRGHEAHVTAFHSANARVRSTR
jgi:hypothetical protein